MRYRCRILTTMGKCQKFNDAFSNCNKYHYPTFSEKTSDEKITLNFKKIDFDIIEFINVDNQKLVPKFAPFKVVALFSGNVTRFNTIIL